MLAWRGRDGAVRVKAAELEARAQQLGFVVRLTMHALMVLELGLGNYQVASSLAREDWEHDLALGGCGLLMPSRHTFAAATVHQP